MQSYDEVDETAEEDTQRDLHRGKNKSIFLRCGKNFEKAYVDRRSISRAKAEASSV